MPHVDGTDDGVNYGVKGQGKFWGVVGLEGTATFANVEQQGIEAGVIGFSVGGSSGVAGINTNPGGGPAIYAFSAAGNAVFGQSSSTQVPAIQGHSNATPGVQGESNVFDAVVGQTGSDAHAGVTGRNLTKGANGGVGIYGVGGRYAGKFDGDLQVNGHANVTTFETNDATIHENFNVAKDASILGNLNVTKDITLAAADCAEDFNVGVNGVEPGTVMVLDGSGLLCPSEHGYDKRVAGVVSGAGDYRPGMILDRRDSSQPRMPIALVGKVYCKVDAQYGAVAIGDLLTTSPTPGHAMRAVDPLKAFGAVIGKALRPLKSGQDLIPILVALQ